MNKPENTLKYNSIPEQKLYSPAQLTIVSWNNIINQLQRQGNDIVSYLNKVHSYLFDEDIAIPSIVSSTNNGIITSSMFEKYEGYETTKQDTISDLASIRSTANSAVQPGDLTIYAKKPTIETFTISSWTADANISPYTHKATVTLTATLSNGAIVELLNDNPILFANYGFAIGSISEQVATIYALDEPDSSITLKIKVGD